MEKTRKTTSKLLAVLLVIAMCISLMPTFVFAAADDVTYTKASSIEAGKEYLFVGKSGNAEKYYALANNDNSTTTDGSGQKQTVTVSNNSITVSASKAESISWKAAASGSGYTFTCGGKNLSTGSNNRIAMGSSATVLTASGTTLRSGNLTLCYGDNSAASSTYMFFLGNPGNNIKAVDVYVRVDSGSSDPTTGDVYSLTNKFEMGKTYLIVSVNSGSGVALANNSSTSSNNGFSTVSVNVANGQIAVSSALSKAEWAAKSTGTGTNLIGLYNGNNVLKVDASSTSSPFIKTGDTSYNAGGFGYTSNSHVSYPYGTNPQDYYIGTSNGNFKASNTENNLGSVYIFVKGEGGSTDPVDPTPTDPPVTPSGDAVYLGFTSDAHNKTNNTSANRLSNWLSNVSAKLGNVVFADFGACGDMGDAGASGNTFWTDAQAVIDVVRNSRLVSGNGFFVAGNHEWQNGSFGSTSNATKSYYTENGGKLVTADYVLYSFGVASSTNNNMRTQDITALGNYLATAPTDRPIFVLSHFPLHNESYRNIANKDTMISTLNEYADDHTIIFLWGHNHTDSDPKYDTIYTGSLDGQSIGFTYCAAGCMSDSEYGTGSASVKGKGLVAAIDNGSVTLTYYTENASVVATKTVKIGGGSVTPVDPPTPSGTTIDLTPTTANQTESATIGVGDTITVKLTNTSTQSNYDFKVSFSKSGVASASVSSVNVAKNNGTAEFTITGLAEGTVTVTIANENSYSSQYQRKATINLTVGNGGSDEPVTPPTPSGTTINLTPTTANQTESATIGVGDTITVKLTNTSEYSDYDFKVSFSKSGVASASASSVNVAKNNGTGEFTITGLAEGTVTVTIANENSYGSQYQRKATLNLTVGNGGSDDPVDPPVSTTTVNATARSGGQSYSATAAKGDVITVNLTNGSSYNEKTYTISVSGSGVAQSSVSSITIPSSGTKSFTINALKEGTATITCTASSGGGSDYVATINLTVGNGGTDPVDPPVTPTTDDVYSLTNKFEMGKTYLIVSVNNGSGVALANNGSSTSGSGFSTVAVTVADNQIAVSSALSKAEWTAKSTGTGTNLIGLYNGNNVLKVDASSTSSPFIKTGDTSYNAGGFGYTSKNHVSYPYGQNPQDYFIGSNGSNSFKASNTENNLGSVYIFVKGEGGGSDDPVVPPTPTGDETFVAFSSDVHNGSGNVSSANRLQNWISTLTGKLGGPFDRMGFCGDMGPASGSQSSFFQNAQQVMDVVENSDNVLNGGFYVCGNHEYNPGSYTHNYNSTTQKYSDAGTYVIADNYILYSLGARQWDEKYSDDDINAMSDFLKAHADFEGPIFILAHFPLHSYSSGSSWGWGGGSSSSGESSGIHDGSPAIGSAKIINVLNDYENVIFLWGHNHSSSNDHYDQVYTDKINDTEINFTYAAAGCMSDSEYGSSGNVKGKGLVAAIGAETVTLTYYDANGNIVGTPAVIEISSSAPAVSYTVTATAGANGSISPAGAVKVGEGRSKTFTFTPNAGYEVDTVTVNGSKVTVSGNSYTLSNVKADTTINVTFKQLTGGTYAPASKAENGGKYLLVSNGYALYNNNGKISAVPVTVSGNNVIISESNLAGAVWTFTTATGSEKSGDFTVANNGYYFSRVSDASGNAQAAEITKSLNVSDASGLPYYQWSYNASNGQLSQVGGQDQSATFYAYYNASSNAFYTASDAQGLKLYVVTDAPAHTHSAAAAVRENEVAATCKAAGSYDEVVYCSVCGEEMSRTTKTIAKLSHVAAEAVQENVKAATCQAAGSYDEVVYCSVCGEEMSRTTKVIGKLNHIAAAAVQENVKAATCQAAGSYDEVVYCSVCGDELSRTTKTIAKIDHTPGEVIKADVVEASCHATGSYTELVLCKDCNTIISRQTVVTPKLDHVAVTDAGKAATCTATGLTEGSHCSVCGETLVEQKVIPAKGHTAGETVQENVVNATCTVAGSYDEVVYCVDCNIVLSKNHVTGKVLPHTPGEAVIENVKDATCKAAGSCEKVIYCTVCKAELSRETKVIDKLAHTPVTDVAVAATCTATGLTEGSHCSVCGEILVAQEVVPMKDHTPGAAVIENTVEATCSKTGSYDEVVYCSVCKAELSRVTKTIDKLAHTPVTDAAVAATCTATGLTEGSHCSVCGEILVAQEVVPMKGHTPGAVVIENMKAATCKAAGSCEEVIYCTVCNEEISRVAKVIDKLAHTPAVDAAVAATCTETGLTEGIHCSVCGEILIAQEVVPALGHSFKDGKCTVCGAIDPNFKNPFTDIGGLSESFQKSILWAYNNGIASGKTATTFDPNGECTRGQVVTFLWRAAGKPEPTPVASNPYSDVKEGAYYYKAILWAAEQGITAGYADGTFKPDQVVSRAQFITFLWRYEGKPMPTSSESPFTDVTGGAYYNAILWGVENGIVSGYGNGTFCPNNVCTRAHVVAFLYRYANI